jgi:L-asparaginase II
MSGHIVLRRGDVVESRHRVHVAVTDPEGRLVAWSGHPELMTHFRSAAKPFQALPLVEDGVVEAFGITEGELALACGSHGGEEAHVAGARRILEKAGVPETALELGAHPPMNQEAARALLRGGREPLPIHNNCSGKHAGMLALARHHGWPLEGYRLPDHPVQRRMTREVARWTGVPEADIRPGVDGCGVVCFGVPLRAMARSWAAFAGAAAGGEAGPGAVVRAMAAHPFEVAGTGRLCTRVIEATRGAVLAKVGAEGVYGAAARDGRVGIAIKVEDGARRAAEVALVRVLELLELLDAEAMEALTPFRGQVPVSNTRGEAAAFLETEMALRRPVGPVGALDEAVGALVRLSGALATRDPARIREAQARAARAASPDEVEEVMVQAYLFLGFPGALNPFVLWRRNGEGGQAAVADGGPGADAGSRGDAGPSGDPAGWEARGEEVCRRVYGDRYDDLRANIRGLHPDLDRWMVVEGYGKVLGRPGLELSVRELCIVGLLAVLDAPVQLYSHLRGALAVGADEARVEDALRVVDEYMDDGVRSRALETWDRVKSRVSRKG